ncbi:putative glutathione dehydrogenase (ascorbate) [Helianthus annuus]|nr:putative glutathione dehydrogenase (ascorbate) [Helianthus annuus]
MSAIRINSPTTALTLSIKHLTCNPSFPTNCRRFKRNTVAMSSAPLQVCAKSSLTVPNKLGDCKYFTFL